MDIWRTYDFQRHEDSIEIMQIRQMNDVWYSRRVRVYGEGVFNLGTQPERAKKGYAMHRLALDQAEQFPNSVKKAIRWADEVDKEIVQEEEERETRRQYVAEHFTQCKTTGCQNLIEHDPRQRGRRKVYCDACRPRKSDFDE